MPLSQILATFAAASHIPNWLIAFSGGADSVLLLDLAVETAVRFPDTRVTALYLHHYSTPIESERSKVLDFTAHRARQLLGDRFTLRELRTDIALRARRLRRSWEHTASVVRRRHLERIARQLGGAQVFTGHQFSDYTETLQLRAERRVPESAWPTLSVRDEITDFLRPLAFLTRQQVRSLARNRGLRWFEDPANSDIAIARNRLRAAELSENSQFMPPEKAMQNCTPRPQRVHPRELRMPVAEWLKLPPVMRARAIYRGWQQLAIVKRFTRNDFARAQRLPFSLPPLFVHTETLANGEFVIFRRGLGVLRRTAPPAANCERGDAITRSVTLRRPYGRKSVTKLFSERKLSPRQRRLTWVQMQSQSNEALRIFFPDGALL